MRRLGPALLVLLGATALGAERVPVLVELFTSEGCSSCPPADEALAALSREQPLAGVLLVPLELHVDYWNSLGWVDPFSLPEATGRQERYASAGGHGTDVYTPQMVVDGTRSFVAERGMALQAASQAAALPKRSLQAQLRSAPGGVEVELHVGPGEQPVALWLALTEAGLSSRVTRGENRGRTLVHAPVVRELEQVAEVPPGGWTGSVRLAIANAWHRDALSVVAFAQEKKTLRVVGVWTARVGPPTQSSGAAAGAP
jgi:hypothetical protein